MGVEEVLVARLEAQVALVSNRIYPVEAPQNPATPFITYQRVGESKEEGIANSHGLAYPVFQIDCWALSPTSARAVAAQVRAALNRWDNGASSPVILDVLMRDPQGDMGRDPDQPDSEARLYRYVSTWEVQHRE